MPPLGGAAGSSPFGLGPPAFRLINSRGFLFGLSPPQLALDPLQFAISTAGARLVSDGVNTFPALHWVFCPSSQAQAPVAS